MKRSRNSTTSLLVLALILSCASCGRRGSDESIPQTLTMGWIGPLTGPVSLLGIDNLNAIQMAAEDYEKLRKPNEPKIKIIAEDDEYDSQKSLACYRALVAEHRPVIIFLSTYTAMFVLADEALRDGILLINPVDNDANLARLNKNTFMIAKQTESLAGVISNAMGSQGKQRALILHFNGDDFMPSVAELVKQQFERVGGSARMMAYEAGTTDFRSSLESGLRDDADAYVLLGYAELGDAMMQAREMGITAPFYTANVMMKERAPEAIEGTQFFDFTHRDGNAESARAFLDRYERAHQRHPILQWTAYQAYDAAAIAIQAIRTTLHEEGRFVERVRGALLKTKGFRGLSGDISISDDGSSRGIQPGLYEFRNGQSVGR